MFTCLAQHAIGVTLPWESCLPLARQAGFQGIDLEIDPKKSAAHYCEKFAEYGLRCGGMSLPVNFRGKQPEYEAGLSKLRQVAPLAREIGLSRFYTWILSFSDMLTYKQNLAFHAEHLGPAAKILADHGCTLGLEFLGPRSLRVGHRYPFVHTLEQMLDLCEQVGPNCGLLLDSWHWYTSLGTLEDLRALEARQVVYVHVNDAPLGLSVDRQKDLVRTLPGATGVQDIGGFLNALRSIGYDGPVVPEPFDANLKKLPPEEAVELTGQAMRRIWSMPAATPLPGTMQVIATGGRKAWLVEQPVPTPQGHEVIVKVYASPICGSNLGGFLKEGTVINDGHEGAGEVVAVAQSNLLKVGDRVALAPLNACGRCEHCRRGDAIYCTHRPTIYGAFAQFIRVADVLCIPIPPDLDYARASLLGCCLGPAYQAIKRLNVRAFDTVVITGLGPVGLGALALCSFLGAKALALDTVPYRLELARQMGAAVALQADAPDLAAQLRVAVGEPGLLRAIECSGQERALRLLIDSAGVGAQIAMIGENHDPVPIRPSEDFIRKGLTLTGCWHMNVNDAPDLIRFLQRRPELADKLISHRFGLGGVQQAFDTFASRQSAKVVVMPWEK